MSDKIHAAIFLLRAVDVFQEADPSSLFYTRLKDHAAECRTLGINPILLISQPDKLDHKLQGKGYKSLFSSEQIGKVYDNLRLGTGFNLNPVFPCKLYSTEQERDPWIEVTAMRCFNEALKKSLEMKEKFEEKLKTSCGKKSKDEETDEDAKFRRLEAELDSDEEEEQQSRQRRPSKASSLRSKFSSKSPAKDDEENDDEDETPKKAKDKKSKKKEKTPVQKPPATSSTSPKGIAVQFKTRIEGSEKKKQRLMKPEEWTLKRLQKIVQELFKKPGQAKLQVSECDIDDEGDLEQHEFGTGLVVEVIYEGETDE